MRHYASALLLGAFACASWADCLEVTETAVDASPADFAWSVNWRVSLVNACDQAQDADMTIRFVDSSGDTITELSRLITVPMQGSVQEEQSTYVPSRQAERIEGIEVELVERPLLY